MFIFYEIMFTISQMWGTSAHHISRTGVVVRQVRPDIRVERVNINLNSHSSGDKYIPGSEFDWMWATVKFFLKVKIKPKYFFPL